MSTLFATVDTLQPAQNLERDVKEGWFWHFCCRSESEEEMPRPSPVKKNQLKPKTICFLHIPNFEYLLCPDMDYFSQSNWYPFPCCALEGRQKTSGSEEKDGFGSKEMGQGLGTLILWQFVLRTHRFLFSFCEGTDASTWWNFRSENSPCGCAPASMQACQTENGKDLVIWNCSCCIEKFDFTYFINGLAAVVCFEVSQNSAGGKKKIGASIWKGVRFFRAWSCVRQDLGHLWKKSFFSQMSCPS